jgi:hypothetical protein
MTERFRPEPGTTDLAGLDRRKLVLLVTHLLIGMVVSRW